MFGHVLPGEAQDRPAEELEPVVSLQVLLPPLRPGVPSEAVNLDAHTTGGIREVEPSDRGLPIEHLVLGAGILEPSAPDKAEEPRLERAFGESVTFLALLQQATDRRTPCTARWGHLLPELPQRCPPFSESIVQGSTDERRGGHAGEVEQRSLDAGGGDTPDRCYRRIVIRSSSVKAHIFDTTTGLDRGFDRSGGEAFQPP